jgi:hypothetical protein
MVPKTVSYDADPISQIRFPGTPSHLHQHAKLHVLGLHEPSLEAKRVERCISERQAFTFAILLGGRGGVAPGVEGLVAMVPVRRCLFDG